MKANTHPTWYKDAKVTCACGETFTTGSTVSAIRVEICSNCHPLFTGQAKLVDTLGQVDKFRKKAEAARAKREERNQIEAERKMRVEHTRKERPSLKDLLMQARKQATS